LITKIKAEGEIVMKKGIHPEYHRTKVTCISCGATFETGSTLKEIKVDTCSNCHPFYTGKQRYVQADGRIDRFNRKYGLDKKQENK
jgi:large subunit ribosomal protein L31